MRAVVGCLEMLSACALLFAALWTVAQAGASCNRPQGYLVTCLAPGAALVVPVRVRR